MDEPLEVPVPPDYCVDCYSSTYRLVAAYRPYYNDQLRWVCVRCLYTEAIDG